MKKYSHLIVLFILVFITACNKDDDIIMPEPCNTVCDYLYLGHIYEEQNRIDLRVENAGLSKYSQIWLGGDVCSETTKEEATLDYLDSLFDLSSKNTHWSVGNHDTRNGNLNWITSHTGRDLYYSEYKDGLTFLVLNTTYSDPDDCLKMEVQLELIRSVCDTISNSSHLIVLMHNVVWGFVEGVADPATFANANASWIPFDCLPPWRFESEVYPGLVKVQERGIPVICIAGDMGQTVSTYEHTSNDGVVFLGSGITSEIAYHEQWPTFGKRDSVMVLTHDIIGRELNWEFIDIDDI